jgi:translation initiation factor IF-2
VAAAFAGVLLLGIPVAVYGLQHRGGGPDGTGATRANDRLAGTVLGDSSGPGTSVGSAAPSPTRGKAKKGAPGTAPATLAAPGTGDGEAAGPGSGSGSSPGSGSGTAPADEPGSDSTATAKKAAGQSPAATAPTAPPIVYTAVAGPDCDSGQRFQKHGYTSDAKTGWSTSTGGYVGGGCDGHYVSVPMSGSATKDAANTTNWLFDLPSSVSACRVSVYIPANSSLLKVGGTDTYYTVYRYFLPKDSNQIGHFTINQVAHEGSWYNLSGWYPITEKKLSVELHDRGLDWQGSTRTYAHHAASAVRVSCTA